MNKWFVVLVAVMFCAVCGYAQELKVLEVPKGGKFEERMNWKAGTSFSTGAALDNGSVVVLVVPGSEALVLASARNPATAVDLKPVLDSGANAKIDSVKAGKKDDTEASLEVALAGGGSLSVKLSLGTLHVEIAGGKGVSSIDVCGKIRNTVLPDFFGFDAMFVPQRFKSDKLTVPAENFLLNFLEGGDGIAMCAWQGTLALGKDADRGTKEPKVELFLSGEGAGRMINKSRIEFAGKPVFVAMLTGKSIWFEQDVSGWEAQKPTELAWKPPFEAVWRSTFMAKEGMVCSDLMSSYISYDGFYRDGIYKWVADKTAGEVPTMSIQGLWRYFICSFWINKDKPYIALYADVNERKAVAGKNNDEIAVAKKEGRAPTTFYPKNVFEKALIYPMSRRKDTPISEKTPVDIMRDCLGQGPCEYVLDLEGVKGRKSGGSRETMATCGNWDNNVQFFVAAAKGSSNPIWVNNKNSYFELNGKRLAALKPGEKFPQEFEDRLVMNLEDMVLFVTAVNGRLREYQAFDTNLIAYCKEEMGKSEKVKPVAEKILKLAEGLQKTVSEQKMNGFNKQRDDWDAKVKAMITDVKAGKYDTFEKVGAIRDQYAEPQDVTVSACRRFTKSIRLEVSTTDSSDPEVLKFTSEVRTRCHNILRNKHQMEGA